MNRLQCQQASCKLQHKHSLMQLNYPIQFALYRHHQQGHLLPKLRSILEEALHRLFRQLELLVQ